MKIRYIILIVFAGLVITALYFLPTPFSITQQFVLSIFKESTFEEFEKLDEIKLLRQNYNVTRTGEHFNTMQSHYSLFYFIEPGGTSLPPMMYLVATKDLISGQIHLTGSCFNTQNAHRIETKQIMPYLQEYDCFEDTWLTQSILDEKFPPFSIMNHATNEILDDDKIIKVIIPQGISKDSKMYLEPSIITAVIGKNNTIQWINQDESASTLYSKDPNWTTGVIEPGEISSVTFNEPGVYEYHGYFHEWKKGTIVVLEET